MIHVSMYRWLLDCWQKYAESALATQTPEEDDGDEHRPDMTSSVASGANQSTVFWRCRRRRRCVWVCRSTSSNGRKQTTCTVTWHWHLLWLACLILYHVDALSNLLWQHHYPFSHMAKHVIFCHTRQLATNLNFESNTVTCLRCGMNCYIVLLEIYLYFQRWKNFEDRLRFDEVTAMSFLVSLLLKHNVVCKSRKYLTCVKFQRHVFSLHGKSLRSVKVPHCFPLSTRKISYFGSFNRL